MISVSNYQFLFFSRISKSQVKNRKNYKLFRKAMWASSTNCQRGSNKMGQAYMHINPKQNPFRLGHRLFCVISHTVLIILTNCQFSLFTNKQYQNKHYQLCIQQICIIHVYPKFWLCCFFIKRKITILILLRKVRNIQLFIEFTSNLRQTSLCSVLAKR